jgi:hypothetical protein
LHWRSPGSSVPPCPIPVPRQHPFRWVMRPIRQVSLHLSASGLRFLGHLVPAEASAALTRHVLVAQTPSGLPRSAYPTQRRRLRLSSGGTTSAWGNASVPHPGHIPFWSGLISLFSPLFSDEGSHDGSLSLAITPSLAPDRREAGGHQVHSRVPDHSEDFVVPAASHPTLTHDACAGRELLAEQQVTSCA